MKYNDSAGGSTLRNRNSDYVSISNPDKLQCRVQLAHLTMRTAASHHESRVRVAQPACKIGCLSSCIMIPIRTSASEWQTSLTSSIYMAAAAVSEPRVYQ